MLSILGKPGNYGILKNAKSAVPLKCLGNFGQSVKALLINLKIHFELMKTKTKELDKSNPLKILITAAFQKVLFLAFNNTNVNNDKNPIKNIDNRVEKYSRLNNLSKTRYNNLQRIEWWQKIKLSTYW